MLGIDASDGVHVRYQLLARVPGGLFPGNKNDDVPVRDPLDLSGRTGNTCQFDLDCGIGAKCLKGSGIYGVCMGG